MRIHCHVIGALPKRLLWSYICPCETFCEYLYSNNTLIMSKKILLYSILFFSNLIFLELQTYAIISKATSSNNQVREDIVIIAFIPLIVNLKSIFGVTPIFLINIVL